RWKSCGYGSGHSRNITRKGRGNLPPKNSPEFYPKPAGDVTCRRWVAGRAGRPSRRAHSASLKVMKLARPWRSTRIETERFLGRSLATWAKCCDDLMAWLFRWVMTSPGRRPMATAGPPWTPLMITPPCRSRLLRCSSVRSVTVTPRRLALRSVPPLVRGTAASSSSGRAPMVTFRVRRLPSRITSRREVVPGLSTPTRCGRSLAITMGRLSRRRVQSPRDAADPQAPLGRRAVCQPLGHEGACRPIQAEGVGQVLVDLLAHHAEPAAADLAGRLELVGHVQGDGDRNGEGQAHEPAG